MTAPSHDTIRRRLERAGYVHLSGWVPAAFAKRVEAQVEAHAADVAKLAEEPPAPRGRPRKDA